MIDKRPFLIARCLDAADVIAAVNFGRDNKLPVAIRGGGHNGPGLGGVDDGLVIDLSTMKGVRVDPAKRTVRAGAGCVTGDLDHAAHAFGLAVPFGIVSTTGVAGLTLSGGPRLPEPPIWARQRQPARSGRGARRRQLPHGEGERKRRAAVGAPRGGGNFGAARASCSGRSGEFVYGGPISGTWRTRPG